MLTCDCCGDGVLEVKCPYCYKNDLPETDESRFCMNKNDDGTWTLKRNHTYYYQVQLQLHVCRVEYADFVVWSENTIAIQRVLKDEAFIQSNMVIARSFFKYAVLPEVVGKWYTRAPVAQSDGVVPVLTATTSTVEEGNHDDSEDESRLWCYCEQPSFGQMVMCDNKKCPISWFHFECLRIRTPPKGKWYCPNCRKLSKFDKSKK